MRRAGELLQASEWKRAAIVWAFTYEGTNQNDNPGGQKCPGEMSLSAFRDCAISGLSSRTTIRKYRKAWQLAIEGGIAIDVKPGDTVILPDAEWSDYFHPKPKVPDVLPGYCTRCGAGTEPGTGEGICHSCE